MLTRLLVLCDLGQKIFKVRVSVWIAIGEVTAFIVTEIKCEAERIVVTNGYFVWSLIRTFVVAYVGTRSLPHEIFRLTNFAA